MLLLIKEFKDLRFSELMEVYMEENMQNGSERYCNEPASVQLTFSEQDFYAFLREIFFQTKGAYYAVWQVTGNYVSALRLEPYKDGLLIEALETKPAERKKGYAKALMLAVLSQFAGKNIYSHVLKTNVASLRTHDACGFRRIKEYAVYIDGSVTNKSCTFLYGPEGKSC